MSGSAFGRFAFGISQFGGQIVKGSLSNIVSRLQRAFPSGWFPTQSVNNDGSVPRIYALEVGAATMFEQIYNAIAYTKNQTRTPTSSDGFLDLRSYDLFGLNLPRLPGESDESYIGRIDRYLFQPANTQKAISDAITALTGSAPEMIEPWNPSNVGVIDGGGGSGAMYFDADCTATPARYVDPSLRNQIFIESTLPIIRNLGNVGIPAWDAQSYYETYTASMVDLTATQSQGVVALYSLINRLKAQGILVWVKVVPYPSRPSLFWDEPGVEWDVQSQWDSQRNG